MTDGEFKLVFSHCEQLSEVIETALERMRRETWSRGLALHVQQDLQTALTLIALEHSKEDRDLAFTTEQATG